MPSPDPVTASESPSASPDVEAENSPTPSASPLPDNSDPSVVISSTAGANTNTSPIHVTATFSKSVTGLTIGALTIGNGSTSNFTGSGTTYTFDVTPTGQGDVTIDIAASVAQDLKGHNNTAATQYVCNYDLDAPLAVLSGVPSGTNSTTTLAVSVLTTDGTANYKYKVGVSASTDCTVSTGYSSSVSQSTLISQNISTVADGSVKLCVVGADLAGNWQAYADATSATWTKDATPPTAVLDNVPSGTNDTTVLAVDVLSTNGTSDFKYKVGVSGSTNCTSSSGYSGLISQGTAIVDSIAALADGGIKLCVVGQDAVGNLQTYANATSASWTKLSAPTVLVLTGTSTTPTAGSCADFTVTAKNNNAVASPVSSAVTVNLSGQGFGVFYSDANCTAAVTSVQIAASASSKVFYYSNLHNETGISLSAVDASTTLTQATLGVTSNAWPVSIVSNSSEHTCTILNSLGLWCWGLNSTNEIGSGSKSPMSIPTPVFGLPQKITSIGLGTGSICALWADKSVGCWGLGTNGQLGDNTILSKATAVAVQGLGGDVKAISVGATHACAILEADGSVKCWGNDLVGQLGNNASGSNFSTAVAVQGLGGVAVTAITAGFDFTCALMSDQTADQAHPSVMCWGNDIYGQLGNNTSGAGVKSTLPVTVGSMGGLVTAIAAGSYHVCALMTADSSVKCWGLNTSGQLGDNTVVNKSLPVSVQGLSGAVGSLAGGGVHACALLADHSAVQCWGNNFYGQLGNSANTNSSTAVSVATFGAGLTATGISTGAYHSCAIISDKTVRCWGSNGASLYTSRTLGNNSTVASNIPVSTKPLRADPAAKLQTTTIGIAAFQMRQCREIRLDTISTTGGISINSQSAITVNVSKASHANLYSDSACGAGNTINQCTIPQGSNNTVFYFKDTFGGNDAEHVNAADNAGVLSPADQLDISISAC